MYVMLILSVSTLYITLPTTLFGDKVFESGTPTRPLRHGFPIFVQQPSPFLTCLFNMLLNDSVEKEGSVKEITTLFQ